MEIAEEIRRKKNISQAYFTIDEKMFRSRYWTTSVIQNGTSVCYNIQLNIVRLSAKIY